MSFDIGAIVANASDYARSYLFYAQITRSPVGIEFSPTHKYLVKSTSLPQTTVSEIETDWQGMKYTIGGTTEFETFDIIFKSDPAQALRSSFLAWQKVVHDPITNIHGLPIIYFGTIGLSQLNHLGQPTIKYDLMYAWPTVVSTVELDYGNKEISEFTVTFRYLYHKVSPIDIAVLGAPAPESPIL